MPQGIKGKMTNLKYLENHGYCPHLQCGSTQLDFGDIHAEPNGMRQEVLCLRCEKEWFDLYTLIGFQPKEN